MTKKSKILLYDIETAPLLSYTWGLYEQNVVEVERDWYILSVAWKWLGEKKVHVMSLPQFKTWEKDREDDKEIVKKLWELFNEAKVIVAHNGNAFDIKKSNVRFLVNGMQPPSPYKTVDTKVVAKNKFRFDSNSLNNLGEYLKLGKKVETGGFKLWKGCMERDEASWKKMMKYNKQDVVLLEKVYLKLLPWMTTHPYIGGECKNCGGSNLIKKGTDQRKNGLHQEWKCLDCGSWTSTKIK